MKRILLGAAALAIAVPAMAQMQPPLIAPNAPMAPGMQVTQTRDQAVAKVRDHFAKMDGNRDGFVAGDEMQAMRGKHGGMKRQMGERRARGGDRMAARNPAAAFDRLDANRDGMISRDEFGKAREMRSERKMNRMGGRALGGRMMRMADLDKDGRVSLQEATNSALQRFDRVDINRDGQVTPDERRQNREMRKQMRAPKAG